MTELLDPWPWSIFFCKSIFMKMSTLWENDHKCINLDLKFLYAVLQKPEAGRVDFDFPSDFQMQLPLVSCSQLILMLW